MTENIWTTFTSK